MRNFTNYQKTLCVALMGLIVAGCQSTAEPIKSNSTVSRTSNKNEVAQLRTSLAGQYVRENKLDAAQQQLELAFAADARYAPAYTMMGVLLQQEGSAPNLAKADGYFKRAIEIDPQLMQARNNYGVYLFQMKRYSEAIAQFEIAGAALGYEGRIASLENLGRAYLQIGNAAKAQEIFGRVLSADASSVVAQTEMINLLLQQKQTVQAKQMYDNLNRAWGSAPKSPDVLLLGIKVAMITNNNTQRQALSQELLSRYPLSDEARRLKAWLANPRTELK